MSRLRPWLCSVSQGLTVYAAVEGYSNAGVKEPTNNSEIGLCSTRRRCDDVSTRIFLCGVTWLEVKLDYTHREH